MSWFAAALKGAAKGFLGLFTGGGFTGWVVTLLLGAALGGWGGWRVQAWRHQVQDAQRTERALAAVRAARADEMVRVRNLERINDAQIERETKMLAAAAAARRAVAGLRNKIAELNARELPQNPGVAALAGEARAARDLLGECAGRYRAVDESARSLGNQVIGLQAFATDVCKAGQGGPIAPSP